MEGKKEKKLISALLIGFVTMLLVNGLYFIIQIIMERSSVLVRIILGILLLWIALTFYCRVATERDMKRSRRYIIVLATVALDVAVGEGLIPVLIQNGLELSAGAFLVIRLLICFFLFSAAAFLLISISRKYEDVNDGMGEKDRDYAPKERFSESSVFQTRTTPQVKFWLDINKQDKKNK
jgi:Kef-type K+ transport system membrane component KefB